MKPIRKQEKNSASTNDNDQLPARSRQSTALLQAPRQRIKIVIERSAGLYYTTCRRLAGLLNRKK